MQTLTKRLVLCALFCFSGVALSQGLADGSLRLLEKTDIFAFGGTGYAGTISNGEKNFKNIMALPPFEAEKAFEAIFAEGNPQAKAYALAGIRKLDRKRFTALAESLKKSDVKVETMSGCIVETKPLRTVTNDIALGNYDEWINRSR